MIADISSTEKPFGPQQDAFEFVSVEISDGPQQDGTWFAPESTPPALPVSHICL